MRRSEFLRRATGVVMALTALDGAQLGRLLENPVVPYADGLRDLAGRGGGTIWFPPGRYEINGTLMLRPNESIRGIPQPVWEAVSSAERLA